MKPVEFVSQLSALRFDDVFNPYSEQCGVHDREGAPEERANALVSMLEQASRTEIDSLWIGRDLGHRGGRRTGLALTDDFHIQAHALRWNMSVQRPTKSHPVAERTASVIWGVLNEISSPIFLWNVFPLHPHEPDKPFTNRTHNALERVVGVDFLASLVRMLRPKRLIALGNEAEKSALKFDDECQVVKARHPSYGGQTIFLRQIRDLYQVQESRLL